MKAQPMRMCALALLVAGFWAAMLSPAKATIINGLNGASVEYVSGGAIIRDGSGVTFQGRTWDVPSGRTVRATDTGAPLRLGGKDIGINAVRTMTPAAINRAASIALKGLAPVAVGVELWDLFNELRVRPGTCAEGGLPSSVSDLLCFDEGVSPTSQNMYSCTVSTGNMPGSGDTGYGGSPGAACAARLAMSPLIGPYPIATPGCFQTREFRVVEVTPNAYYRFQQKFDTSGEPGCDSVGSWATVSNVVSFPMQPQSSCPASIDFGDPANSIPEGLPPGPDGKCRTGRYNAPITPQVAADKLEAQAPRTGEQLKDLAQDVIERGGDIEASERQLSGPTSSPGTPTVTTAPNPGGGTTTTTKTPTVHYTYNNNTVNYTIVTVTTVNDGTTTTTTTEGTVPDESDQCKTAPDSLGCSKMGKPGDESPAWQTRDVVFAAEDLGFSGACPAPESWEVFGITLTWGYEPVCEVAPFIRFALLAFAGIGAISVVIRETSA